jgi:hypothetical protein
LEIVINDKGVHLEKQWPPMNVTEWRIVINVKNGEPEKQYLSMNVCFLD